VQSTGLHANKSQTTLTKITADAANVLSCFKRLPPAKTKKKKTFYIYAKKKIFSGNRVTFIPLPSAQDI
jgi:hypothetical protein